MKNWLKLLISLLIVTLASSLGSLFTVSSIPTWYSILNKPGFNPPSWLFGPVWTILYLMIAVSLFLVWKNKTKIKNNSKKKAYWIFGIQILLNSLWSIVFFGMHQILLACIVIILLWISIILNIFYFYKISKTASYLLIPYLLWVSFASLLNFAIWILNR